MSSISSPGPFLLGPARFGIGVRDDGSRGHRLASAGEPFVGLIAEHLAEVHDGGARARPHHSRRGNHTPTSWYVQALEPLAAQSHWPEPHSTKPPLESFSDSL